MCFRTGLGEGVDRTGGTQCLRMRDEASAAPAWPFLTLQSVPSFRELSFSARFYFVCVVSMQRSDTWLISLNKYLLN